MEHEARSSLGQWPSMLLRHSGGSGCTEENPSCRNTCPGDGREVDAFLNKSVEQCELANTAHSSPKPRVRSAPCPPLDSFSQHDGEDCFGDTSCTAELSSWSMPGDAGRGSLEFSSLSAVLDGELDISRPGFIDDVGIVVNELECAQEALVHEDPRLASTSLTPKSESAVTVSGANEVAETLCASAHRHSASWMLEQAAQREQPANDDNAAVLARVRSERAALEMMVAGLEMQAATEYACVQNATTELMTESRIAKDRLELAEAKAQDYVACDELLRQAVSDVRTHVVEVREETDELRRVKLRLVEVEMVNAEVLEQTQSEAAAATAELRQIRSEMQSMPPHMEPPRVEIVRSDCSSCRVSPHEDALEAAQHETRVNAEEATQLRNEMREFMARVRKGESNRHDVAVESTRRQLQHQLHNAQKELEQVTWEARQLREDVATAERLLQDARLKINEEQSLHSTAKCEGRKYQRELLALRGQVKTKDSEMKQVAAEVERCQSELVEQGNKHHQLQLQLHAREAELSHVRMEQRALLQKNECALNRQRLDLEEREQTLNDRERFINEHEQLLGKSGMMLRKQRREFRTEVRRAELTNLRSQFLSSPRPRATSPTIDSTPMQQKGIDENESRRRQSKDKGSPHAFGRCSSTPPSAERGAHFSKSKGRILTMSTGFTPGGNNSPRSDARYAACTPSSISSSMYMQELKDCDTFSDEAKEEIGNRIDGAQIDKLRAHRQKLRADHAALEEERRLWRLEAQAVRRSGESDVKIEATRVALESRAASLKKSIDEYRALQQLATSQHSQQSELSIASQQVFVGRSDGCEAITPPTSFHVKR